MRTITLLVPVLLLGAFVLAEGGCAKKDTPSTNPLMCNKACATDQDCGTGGACRSGQCFMNSIFCIDRQTAGNDRGGKFDCTPYACNTATGQCYAPPVQSSNYCANGWNLDVGTGKCATAVPGGGSNYVGGSGTTQFDDTSLVACGIGCTQDNQCGTGMCWLGKCVNHHNFCVYSSTNHNWQGVAISGVYDANGNLLRDTTACGLYACDPIAGSCFTQCFNSSECLTGHNCTGAPNFTCQ